MKLAYLQHERCKDWSGVTLAWVPEDWTQEQFEAAVDRAQAEYLKVLETWKNNPPNNYSPHLQVPLDKYPDTMTRAEIEADWKQKGEVWKAWSEERRRAQQDFGAYLQEQGLTPFWSYVDDASEFSYTVDWGHRHGLSIDYAETSVKSMPGPGIID